MRMTPGCSPAAVGFVNWLTGVKLMHRAMNGEARHEKAPRGVSGGARTSRLFRGADQIDSSIQLCSAALGLAPAMFDTTCPSLKMNSAGMPRTPIEAGEFGF